MAPTAAGHTLKPCPSLVFSYCEEQHLPLGGLTNLKDRVPRQPPLLFFLRTAITRPQLPVWGGRYPRPLAPPGGQPGHDAATRSIHATRAANGAQSYAASHVLATRDGPAWADVGAPLPL